MLILLLSVLPLALAEPPLGDSYLEAAQFDLDHTNHQQYLPPNFAAPSERISKTSHNSVSNQYIGSNSRGINQEYGPPEFRGGLSTEYGIPSARNNELNFRNTISQEYGAPLARLAHGHDSLSSSLGQSFSSASLKSGVSQRYGAPSFRNTPSSVYGAPSRKSSPSTQYGAPEFRSTPSEEYNAPSLRSSDFSYNRNSPSVQTYGVPRSHSRQSLSASSLDNESLSRNSIIAKDTFPQFQTTRSSPSQIYGTPNSPSTQYGAPVSRNAAFDSEELGYRASNGRANTHKYGASVVATPDLKTDAFASSYASTGSPSHEYGAPASLSTVPSHQYGAPHHRDAPSGQGYEYARNAMDLLNQKPANYEFAYKVSDYGSGSDFGHEETRQVDRAEGAYFVLLPDGTKQIVEYEADEEGFRPRISVEPADTATALASDGPY